jgi:thiol-disulfide isomerase/thioredoxin
MKFRIVLLAAAMSCALPLVHGQTKQASADKTAAATSDKPFALMVGDKAPAIAVTEWLKGSEVKAFESGHVYVVEFWATWCGPCIAAFPHLSQLQKEYADKGLTIMGVTAFDPRNSVEKARAMVADKGDKMAYTVGWDNDRKMADAWMSAAGRRGIPCSFVVDKQGRIAFIGHPMEIDTPLAQIIADKYDIESATKTYHDKAVLEAKAMALTQSFQQAKKDSDWDAAIRAADALVAIEGGAYADYAAAKFNVLLVGKKDAKAAYAWAGNVLTGVGKDQPSTLNQIAWMIVDPEEAVEPRDVDLALKCAERANELTGGKNASVLDTVARVYFTQGNIEKAIEVQTKAAGLDKSLEKTLAEYKEALARKARG